MSRDWKRPGNSLSGCNLVDLYRFRAGHLRVKHSYKETEEMMKHTEDFKQEAVRIALTSGLSRRRVAADLGVGLSTLGKWVSQYRPTDLVSALA